VSPDLVISVIGTEDTYPWDAVEGMIHMYYGAFDGYEHILDDLIAEDDWVVARITYRGTHTGEFDGTPATGNPIRYGGTHILRIVDGVIGEFWYLEDDLRLMQQIGLALAPAEDGSERRYQESGLFLSQGEGWGQLLITAGLPQLAFGSRPSGHSRRSRRLRVQTPRPPECRQPARRYQTHL
jgi:predicted ester cyclase